MNEFSRLDLAGRVIGVAVYGSRLYFQRIPSTIETLRISFYEQPTAMTLTTSTPDCLPDHLATQLLLSYSCWKIEAQIEDGIDGHKINTMYWKREFEGDGPRRPGAGETGGVMADLESFLGPEEKVPEEIPADIDYEDCL